MNPTVAPFLEHVDAEVKRAQTKFPANIFRLAALVEEVGELSEAMMEYAKLHGKAKRVWPAHKKVMTKGDIYQEAVQVAAMAARIATEGDPDFVEMQVR